jgi:hypothetical protein
VAQEPLRLPNGNLLVPVSLVAPDGTQGDAWQEIPPGSPDFEKWAPFVEEKT